MNSWLILLFLLIGNQNGRGNNGDSGCGRESDGPQARSFPGERDWNNNGDCGCDNDYGRGNSRDYDNDCGRGRGRNYDNDNDCDGNNDYNRNRGRGRETDGDCGYNNENRFDPRFNPGPQDNSGCGCND